MLRPLERLIYRFTRVDEEHEMHWTEYGLTMLAFSAVSMLVLYGLMRVQAMLPLNPQGLAGLAPNLAFNTAASFTTNSNWQSYAGEATMSYLTQMAGLTYQNFVSAAAGIALAVAFIRGVAGENRETLGNFWVDMTRATLWVLLPFCAVGALLLVSQGVVQNLKPYDRVHLLDPSTTTGTTEQTIAQGPVASQEMIKQWGTNGGGFFNVNSAHPFENPTPFSNFIADVRHLCDLRWAHYHARPHDWFAAAWLGGVVCHGDALSRGRDRCLLGRSAKGILCSQELIREPRPHLQAATWKARKCASALRTQRFLPRVTTAASCGAVNSMHDSFTPLGGLVLLVNMMLGEVIFGGVGAGMYGMLIFVVLSVFIAGLMVGRTPEYLGKKVESFDVQMAMLAVLVCPLTILVFTAIASVSADFGTSSIANPGPHGLSEILYAYTSGTANNGSAFAGLSANTKWYNTTLGLAMLIGRFLVIVPMLALAGNLGRKTRVPPSLGTFPVTTPLFALLLVGVIVIVGVLTFSPF